METPASPAQQEGGRGAAARRETDLRRLAHLAIPSSITSLTSLLSRLVKTNLVWFTTPFKHPATMASSLAWVADYADRLLQDRAQAAPDLPPSPTQQPTDSQPSPLAVLLLWLDCLSFLANCTPQPTPAPETPLASSQGSAGSPALGEAASRPEPGEGSLASQSDNLDEFAAYLAQVVSPALLFITSVGSLLVFQVCMCRGRAEVGRAGRARRWLALFRGW